MGKVNRDKASGEKINGTGFEEPDVTPKREPLFNLPGIIVVFVVAIIGIHAIRTYLLTPEQNAQLIYLFAFIPASFGPLAATAPYPLSGLWSPLTHSLLHGSWMHVAMNLVWMAAFGSPIARRFGLVRFLLLTVVCSFAGALLHYLTAESPFIPVIGASGVVSGYMGAASRFVFSSRSRGMNFDENGRALSLFDSFRNRQFLIFFGMWMGLNFLFGSGFVDITGDGARIAWQAHIGGFLAGIFAFSILDPVKKSHST